MREGVVRTNSNHKFIYTRMRKPNWRVICGAILCFSCSKRKMATGLNIYLGFYCDFFSNITKACNFRNLEIQEVRKSVRFCLKLCDNLKGKKWRLEICTYSFSFSRLLISTKWLQFNMAPAFRTTPISLSKPCTK